MFANFYLQIMQQVVPLTAWTQPPTTEPLKKVHPYQPKERFYIAKDGRKWYYLLVEREAYEAVNEIKAENEIAETVKVEPKRSGWIPLMAEIPMAELSGKLVIGLQSDERLFTVFDSHIDYAKFVKDVSEDHRCFYEIIMGDFPQKPHFDIEVSRRDHEEYFSNVDRDSLKDIVLEKIFEVLANKDVHLSIERDVLVFSSHGKDKISFHIVLDNCCHCNNAEAKQFYKKVYALLPRELQEMKPPVVDHAVYSKKQQFRIVGSQKFESGRTKLLLKEWSYKGQAIKYKYIEEPESIYHENILQLEASLVSNTSTCFLLPSFFEETDVRPDTIDYKEISRESADKAIQLLAELMGVAPDDPRFPYRFLDLKGGIIVLKRLRPSNCRICSRVHEGENPFLFVIDGAVYFHCRRAPSNKKFFVGRIDVEASGDVLAPINDSDQQVVATQELSGLTVLTMRTTIVRADKSGTEVGVGVLCNDVLEPMKLLASQPTRGVKEPDTLKYQKMEEAETLEELPEKIKKIKKDEEEMRIGALAEEHARNLETQGRSMAKLFEGTKGKKTNCTKVTLKRRKQELITNS